jgi:hypothetical protein
MTSPIAPVAPPAPDEVRAELERLLNSRYLRESHQLRALLRHIVEETLAGRQGGLKEYTLGIEVFHRTHDYDPRNDAIVRVQASLLRKKLQTYYENEGKDALVRIGLPRGAYIPSIETVPEEAEAPAELQPASPRRPWLAPFLCGALCASALFALWIFRPNPRPQPLAPAIWGQFLTPGVPTILSFGVPLFYSGGDGIYFRDVHVNTPGEERLGSLRPTEDALGITFRPQEDVYTGIGESIGTHLISRFLEQSGQPITLLNSHFLAPSDFSDKNLIVVSSLRFQTLLQTLKLPSAFTFDSAGAGSILLANPQSNEKSVYPAVGSNGVSTTYSLVSLWPGTRADRRLLRLGGMHSWSTLGAVNYVLDPVRQRELQQTLDNDPPTGPHGRKSPYFEILLRLEGKNEQVLSVHYVTHRYLQAEVISQ